MKRASFEDSAGEGRAAPSSATGGRVRRLARRASLSFAAALLASGVASAQEELRRVPVELAGPLEEARFEALGTTSVVRLALSAGERRVVALPFGGGSLAALEPVAAAEALRVTTTPASGAATVRASEASGPGRLPRGMGRRGLPPVAPARPRPDSPRALLLVGGTLAVLALRRKPRGAAAAGAVAAALVFAFPAPDLARAERRGVDGDATRDLWFDVHSASDGVPLVPGETGWFALPGGVAPELVVDAEGERLVAPGGSVHVLRARATGPLDPATGLPREPVDAWWERSADGRWRALGPWDPGGGAPPIARDGARSGDARDEPAGSPPGWSAAGLPQGVGVLVARPRRDLDWWRAIGVAPLPRESSESR